MDATVTVATSGIGGKTGAGLSIAYSAATSDNPVKGGIVQTAVEVVTPNIARSTNPFGIRLVNEFSVNFGLAKTEEAAEYGLDTLSGRQQQREQSGQQSGQSTGSGMQSVSPSQLSQ